MTTMTDISSDVDIIGTSDGNDDKNFTHDMASRLNGDDNIPGRLLENVSDYLAIYTEDTFNYELSTSQSLW